jgi:hypothetical protein
MMERHRPVPERRTGRASDLLGTASQSLDRLDARVWALSKLSEKLGRPTRVFY